MIVIGHWSFVGAGLSPDFCLSQDLDKNPPCPDLQPFVGALLQADISTPAHTEIRFNRDRQLWIENVRLDNNPLDGVFIELAYVI